MPSPLCKNWIQQCSSRSQIALGGWGSSSRPLATRCAHAILQVLMLPRGGQGGHPYLELPTMIGARVHRYGILKFQPFAIIGIIILTLGVASSACSRCLSDNGVTVETPAVCVCFFLSLCLFFCLYVFCCFLTFCVVPCPKASTRSACSSTVVQPTDGPRKTPPRIMKNPQLAHTHCSSAFLLLFVASGGDDRHGFGNLERRKHAPVGHRRF